MCNDQQETDFKIIKDMHLVLGKGKMLDAIIESAINTDFGGEIRAHVITPIYANYGICTTAGANSCCYSTATAGPHPGITPPCPSFNN